jgi:hypothetical protein
MTDREKLIVALLSEGSGEPDGMVSELEVLARLHELSDQRRRLPVRGPALIVA